MHSVQTPLAVNRSLNFPLIVLYSNLSQEFPPESDRSPLNLVRIPLLNLLHIRPSSHPPLPPLHKPLLLHLPLPLSLQPSQRPLPNFHLPSKPSRHPFPTPQKFDLRMS